MPAGGQQFFRRGAVVDVLGVGAVAVGALLHLALVDRVQRHAGRAVVGRAVLLVVADAVAVDAAQVGAVDAHVHVVITGRVGDAHRQVAVLDVGAAARVGVAENAIIAGRRGALRDAHRDHVEVDARHRPAGRPRVLLVGVGLVVANQAVDVGRVVEIEVLVVVAVTGMALRAAPLVGRHRDAEVVEQLVLAVGAVLETDDPLGLALPLEVAGVQVGFGRLLVAHQARLGAFVQDDAEVQFVDIDIVDRRVLDEVSRCQPAVLRTQHGIRVRRQALRRLAGSRQQKECREDGNRLTPSGTKVGGHCVLLV